VTTRNFFLTLYHNSLWIGIDPPLLREEGEDRVSSFLSIDEDHRVLRFDSFSKVLSSGIRLGFMTGPKPLIDKILLHVQVSVLHASSLSQVIISEMLSRWDIEGLERHIQEVEDFYRARRDAMHAAASRHLTGLCEWSLPRGGMFLWIKVDGVTDTWDMVMERGAAKNIMLVPGKLFAPSEDVMQNESPYMRASYSIADVAKFDLAFERLAELIREEKSKIKLDEVGQQHRAPPRQQIRQQLYHSQQQSLWEIKNRGGVRRQNSAAIMAKPARYKSS